MFDDQDGCEWLNESEIYECLVVCCKFDPGCREKCCVYGYLNNEPINLLLLGVLLLLLLLLLHPFNGLFPSAIWVSRYQKGETSLDLNEARDDGGWG